MVCIGCQVQRDGCNGSDQKGWWQGHDEDRGRGQLNFGMKGEKVVVSNASGGMTLVTIADVNQSNGVIHVVDSVLLPKM